MDHEYNKRVIVLLEMKMFCIQLLPSSNSPDQEGVRGVQATATAVNKFIKPINVNDLV